MTNTAANMAQAIQSASCRSFAAIAEAGFSSCPTAIVASSLEHPLQSGGVPSLGEIGLGIDAIGRGAERRQIDGVDRKPAVLQRLHDGLFVGEPGVAAGLGGLARGRVERIALVGV